MRWCCSGRAKCESEPFSTAERSARVENFFFIFAKEVVVTLASLSVDEVLIHTHATCMSRYGARCPLSPAPRRRSSVQPDYDCWQSRLIAICNALLHGLAFDFFDLHFFALWFAVVSQCPRIRFANCDAKPDKLLPDLRPLPLNSGIKKTTRSEIMTLECSFPSNSLSWRS